MNRLQPEDFEALPPVRTETAETVHARPSLTATLVRSYKARVAGIVVLALVAITLIGPLLWPQDPARQWLSQVSSGPVAAQRVPVIRDHGAWSGPDSAPARLEALKATTTVTRLAWPEVDGANVYRLYRSERPGAASLGIPLAETPETYHADRLQLRSTLYRYTVVAVDPAGVEMQRMSATVRPQLSIGAFEAELLGLPAAQTVDLPAHPLGTDGLGRDMLSRIIHGARTSLLVGISAPLLFIALGAVYGATAGLAGGWLDNAMMRVADFVVALPFLLFMILLRVALGIESGESGLLPLVLAMVVLSWPASARLVRGQVLQLRESAFVLSARLAGASRWYLIWRHLLPNVLPLLLVSLSFAIPQAMFTEALLSFIGMGVVPPTPSWGTLCNEGIKNMLSHPHELLFPAMAISISVLAFNMLGDSLRDALDVNVRRRVL